MIFTEFDQLPRKHYALIAADPPWRHVAYSPKGDQRAPVRHYPTMSLAEICAVPVKSIAASSSHLLLWTTQPHLQQSFEVMKAWGYRYSSVYIFWVKLNPRAADQMFLTKADLHMGLGKTTRKNVELVLLGRRGSPKRLRKDLTDIIIAARRRHSEKPEQFYAHAEAYAPGPRIELFSRTIRKNWDTFGDEVAKFGAPAGAPYVIGPHAFGPPWPWPQTPLLEAAE